MRIVALVSNPREIIVVKTVLFHRRFKRFYGGHMKVFDYFNHTIAAAGYRPEIYLTADSVPDHPWAKEKPFLVGSYNPENADVLFVAGMDWSALEAFPGIEERVPVINLVQGLRHAKPDTELYSYLDRKAVRVCVSDEVREALEATEICNGPLVTIPNGIDLQRLVPGEVAPSTDIFVAGLKQPKLAEALTERLRQRGYSVDCQVRHARRSEFLARIAAAKIAVLLPYEQEGFFLPPLEAMAMGKVVVCPDCGGNRSFCIDGVTALMPEPDVEQFEDAVVKIAKEPDLAARLKKNGLQMSLRFDLKSERAAFHRLLQQVA